MSRIASLTFVGAGVILSSTVALLAAGPGQPDALVPYQGHLDKDGRPVTGTVGIRVGLFPSNTQSLTTCLSAASLASNCGTWSAEFASVDVYSGAFTVSLGSTRALPSGLFATMGNLFVGIAVREGTGGWVVLSGMQQMQQAPFAVRSDVANDFDVQRDLTVGGTLDVTGGIRGRSSVQVDGALSAASLNVSGASTLPTIEGNVAVNGSVTATSMNGGFTTTRATRQTDNDNTPNGNYDVGRTRYLVEATYNAAFPGANTASRAVRLDDTRLIGLCGDEDGCMIRIGMKNWSTFSNSTSTGPYHFFIGSPDAEGDRPWRLAQNAAADDGNPETRVTIAGEDADNSAVEIIRDHNCMFTDLAMGAGQVFAPGGAEAGIGFGLVNYNYNTSYRPTCWLIIDD